MSAFQDVSDRKLVETELQKYKERYDYATSVGKVGIWDWNPVTGKLYWSDQVYVSLGLPVPDQDPTIEMFMEMAHPDDREPISTALKEALANRRPFNIECRIIRNDGQPRVFHAVGKVTFNRDGQAQRMMGTFQDITERKLIETRLQDYKERYDYATSVGKVGIWDWSPVTEKLVWNDEVYVSLGLPVSHQNPTFEIFMELVHPEDREAFSTAVEEALGNRRPFNMEYRVIRNDGEPRVFQAIGRVTFNSDGQPQRMMGTFQDITERKAAEEALRAAKENAEQDSLKLHQSESRFRQLAESGFEGIAIHDNGVILDINQQASNLVGFERDEIVGKNIFSFVALESQETAFRSFTKLSEDMIEIKLIRKDGKAIFVESRARSIDYSGKDARIVIVRDITARKANEEKLRAAKEEAEDATRMKDNFVSLVSHDLRSPLANIQSLLRIVRNSEQYRLDDEKRNECLNKSIDNTEGLLNLIDKLLDLSRLKTGKVITEKRFLSAYSAAETCISYLAFNAEAKGIFIRNEIPRTLRIFADETLFGEALGNIISNAIKFSKKGDTITLFIPRDRPDTIALKDTGVGIPPDILSGIFSGDVRTPSRGTGGEKGTGLGLQYCREIMAAHGGQLTAESEPGKGSVFYLTIPAVSANLMLVDDVQAQREIMKDMLAGIGGLNIMEAENGQQALEKMHICSPHLIVTDLTMPVMDGFRFIKEVKRSLLLNTIPLIAITSVTSGENDKRELDIRNKVFSLGADDFVTKPFIKGDFVPRVQRFLGF
ncbi:MAG: PAS domain-containing protein [Nitrospinota bacterium]|nr:PAS domain-containing protein [Nitrospinota bacterium]